MSTPIRSAADGGAAQRRCRLSAVPTGQRVTIVSTRDPAAGYRMVLLGLVDGVEVEVETRGPDGDLVVAVDGRRFFLPHPIADRIWVTSGKRA